MSRLENLLSATAVAITDAQMAAIKQSTGHTPSAVAALLFLGQHKAQTISQIASVAGLSHSTTVRLVDGLESRGLLERKRGKDKRETIVSLSNDGMETYASIRHAQRGVLTELVERLPPNAHQVLERALSHMLASLTRGRESADHICRFCDEAICDQERCPVERQALALESL